MATIVAAFTGKTHTRIETVTVSSDPDAVGLFARIAYTQGTVAEHGDFTHTTPNLLIESDPDGHVHQIRNLTPGVTYVWKAQIVDAGGVVIDESVLLQQITLEAVAWCGSWYREIDCTFVETDDEDDEEGYFNCSGEDALVDGIE